MSGKKKAHTIVVFDDGETWSIADQCTLSDVTAEQFERLESGEYPKHMRLKARSIVTGDERARTVDQMITDFAKLTPEERNNVMWPYCPRCGARDCACQGARVPLEVTGYAHERKPGPVLVQHHLLVRAAGGSFHATVSLDDYARYVQPAFGCQPNHPPRDNPPAERVAAAFQQTIAIDKCSPGVREQVRTMLNVEQAVADWLAANGTLVDEEVRATLVDAWAAAFASGRYSVLGDPGDDDESPSVR